LAKLNVQKAIGVDIGIPGLRYGKDNFPFPFFLASNLSQLPFRDNKFDFIYSIDVIEHLEDPIMALNEYYRVCRSGGFVFIQTPNYPIKRGYDVWHWFRGSKRYLADDPTHISPFTSFQLKREIVKVGFQIVSSLARNVALQKFFPGATIIRSSWFGHCFGQKIIVVARRP
jgi:ubiquinone/menaquinone biosynthesis C-methylase UbiE